MSDVDDELEGDDDGADAAEECALCGNDHESRNCDLSFCTRCRECVENCGCEEPIEVDAEEWLKFLGSQEIVKLIKEV